MAEQSIQQNNLVQLNKGLHTDNSILDSPRDTYRYALNSVNETELGDSSFISNEESNENCSSLTPGFIPIGKVYIGNNETVIFSVSGDNLTSEIGILDDNCNYTVHVNDADVTISKDKLDFKVEHQIQATYRLRRGCERTVYFTDGINPPRYYNFDKPNQFKRGTAWSAPQFSLYKKLELFPTIDSVQVLDSSGSLLPGSYSILVQHLDEDLNGTEYYELVRDINIYNDSLDKTYSDIQGSSNILLSDTETTGPYKYPKTSKAIRIVLDAVDKNFTYVRFAFVERTNGSGLVSKVVYSEPISVFNPAFTYTGDNASIVGTIEEVELFNANAGIQTAEHIEQIDNMLILANTSGEQARICKLQRYASLIKTDCFVKDIILTTNKEAHNPKNPLVVYNGLTYQPGDIYSLGIVYIFEDYSISPVMHIPGKSSQVENSMIYSPGSSVYPMSNINNTNSSEIYLDNNICGDGSSYWGLDSEGNELRNQGTRHHRFPTRDEIGIGFVKRANTTGDTITYQRIDLVVGGSVKKTDDTYTAVDFNIIVKYKRNGVEESFQDGIYPDSNIKPTLVQSNVFISTDVITDFKLFYQEIGSATQVELPLNNNESELQENGLTYKITLGTVSENNVSHLYTVPIMGLKFSDVILPPEDEIGKKIIGYQIVRQERNENDKNILDSAVVFPMQKSGRSVSTALLAPEFMTNSSLTPSTCEGTEDVTYPTCYNISKRNVMLLTPGHKFMDKTYDGYTSIEQVGLYEREYVARTAHSIQNIYEGTSATGDEDKHTGDDDGFSLRQGVRFTGVKYVKTQGTPLRISSPNTRMYNLDAVNYADTEDSNETLYNLSNDNKALILSSINPGVNLTTYGPNKHQFPYVYIRKDNTSFYQNFRSNPYYLVDNKVFNTDTTQVFGGDTYIAPLRYSNHIFGNAVGALRRKKMSIWLLIGTILITALSIVLSIFSGGSSLIIGGAILVGLGALATFHAARIEVEKFNEIYGDKWHNNLDRTVFDFIYARLFIRENPDHGLDSYEPDPLYLSWGDDTFRWFGEVVGDLWFETQLNISLRVPPMNMENNYLKPLKSYMGDNTSQLMTISQAEYIPNSSIGSGRFHRYIDPDIGPTNSEEWYFVRKITKSDSTRPSGLYYNGISVPQIYLVNPDYFISKGIKKFYTIPLEYDCCSKCTESFPHRIHYSQQSFQEEKADNYRMFLPNNYRDIEGETGEITNLIRWYGNLYAHTNEALWQMQRNFKERVTDNVVSFIGTGSYFELPPEKVLDDSTGSSAGSRHKWGMIKTPAGIFFPSENQRKIYQFDGKGLKPISDLGLKSWFGNNVEVKLDKEYLKQKGVEYPNRDNPSSPLGTGFISTYDTSKQRIIFTKKDMSLDPSIFGEDTGFCINGNTATLFPNMSQIIVGESNAGWSYSGIQNCKMMFYKDVIKTRTEIRDVTTTIANDADIIVHLDMSGSFDGNSRSQIRNAVTSWFTNYASANPNWTGNLYYSIQDGYTSQRCWKVLKFIKTGQGIQTPAGSPVDPNTISKNIIAVSFVNENLIGGYDPNVCYHPMLSNPIQNAASDFYDDYNEFISLYNSHQATGGTFNALNYPINYSTDIAYMTQGFVQHVLAALKGISYTSAEVSAITPNPFMSSGDWNMLTNSLQGNNPYPDDGLENYGWKAVTNRGWNGSGDVITAAQFQDDMSAFLQGITTTIQVEVQVNYVEREFKYVEGDQIPIEELIKNNNSWTMSYSLEANQGKGAWISWHSYIPNFYINVPEKFYSWIYGNNIVWKHNKLGEYQTFYGTYYPHTIEYTSVSNPVTTRVWNTVMLQTEAKTYDAESQYYVDELHVTFNKAIFYNSRQCSGILDLVVKDSELFDEDYLEHQITNTSNNVSIIDRTERDWFINDFRDIRIDYSKPIWKSDTSSVQSEYFTDKVLNTSTMDVDKDWTELESFRDKYLVVRLIFDNFADKKLITNFSVENEQVSSH